MPNGNVLAPLRVPGVGTLQGLQMPDIAGAIQRRRENLLGGEERRLRMGIAVSGEQRAREAAARAGRGEQRDIEAAERTQEEAERKQEEEERKLAKEKWDFYVDLAKKIKSQDDQEWARRVVEEMYGEDVPLFDQTFGDTYDKEAVDRVKRGLKEIKPLLVEPAKERVWIEGQGFVTELLPGEAEEPKEFTLGPGQRRFRGEEEIARVPAAAAKLKKPDMVTMTDVVSGRKFKVEADSEEFAAALRGGAVEGEFPAGRLPLTPEQEVEKVEEKIRVLSNNIARLETTGGADPLALALFADDPAIMEKLTSGKGIEDLITELKGQWARAVARRNELLGTGGSDLRAQAIQALKDAGAPATEANIAEAMRQLGGR